MSVPVIPVIGLQFSLISVFPSCIDIFKNAFQFPHPTAVNKSQNLMINSYAVVKT